MALGGLLDYKDLNFLSKERESIVDDNIELGRGDPNDVISRHQIVPVLDSFTQKHRSRFNAVVTIQHTPTYYVSELLIIKSIQRRSILLLAAERA